jgi:serine/threonine-protein kinase
VKSANDSDGPRLPESIGKYPVTGMLGKGAMGIVYKAFDPHIKRAVAIKTLRREMLEDDERADGHAARFRQEAQAGGRLLHPGIVAVYEYGEERDFAYIAMEYVEGHTLRRYFQRNTRFDEPDIVSIMAQLLDALAHAHQQGIWHRDIKPANIIIMNDGRIKVADFGIARIEASSLTQVGVIMGTPGFMAPEQYTGAAVDLRIDIFSAGVVLYQLLAGVAPFAGPAEAVVHKVCNQDPTPPSEVAGLDHLARFDPVVATALAKNPQDRFGSAAGFRNALLEAYARPVNPTVSEDTILHDATRSPLVVDPSQRLGTRSAAGSAAARPTAPSQSTTALIQSGWDIEVLQAIEARLSSFVGPVARPMVRRAARHTPHLSTLVRMLADQMPNADDRAKFLTLSALDQSAAPGSARSAAGRAAAAEQRQAAAERDSLPEAAMSAPAMLSTLDRERAGQVLATYLGPLAQYVARRAARPGISVAQFHALLADSLVDPADRQKFLAQIAGSPARQ